MTLFKDIAEELRELQVTRRKVLWFALLIAACLLLAAWRLARIGYSTRQVFLAGALLISGLAIWRWQTLTPVYRAWMALAMVLGWFVLRAAVTVSYCLFIVPAGLWFRLTGKDAMNRRLRPDLDSYWLAVETADRSRYLKKF